MAPYLFSSPISSQVSLRDMQYDTALRLRLQDPRQHKPEKDTVVILPVCLILKRCS